MTKVAQQWTEQEFEGLDLGDARLYKRAKRMMERFSANPTASIPDACDSWSETCDSFQRVVEYVVGFAPRNVRDDAESSQPQGSAAAHDHP